uniref:Uncharacterized protein n=1 Tax=Anguilla anguilla TaxID=7936 RepID=A0A0E9X0J7_ANGAN
MSSKHKSDISIHNNLSESSVILVSTCANKFSDYTNLVSHAKDQWLQHMPQSDETPPTMY